MKKFWLIMDCIFFIILTALDQISKYYIHNHMLENETYDVLSGFISFHYQKNTGGAWGILENQNFFFIFVACIILLCIIYIVAKLPAKKKYNALHITLTIMAAGILGNMLDRVIRGYVIDYMHLDFIKFPVFNISDILISISSLLIIILFIFYYKEKDFQFLDMKQNKYREIK